MFSIVTSDFFPSVVSFFDYWELSSFELLLLLFFLNFLVGDQQVLGAIAQPVLFPFRTCFSVWKQHME